jgi:hypothetical protein
LTLQSVGAKTLSRGKNKKPHAHVAILFLSQTETGIFAGQTVTGASTIAMYTYAGDLNFDGLVDAADYGVIDNWVQFPGTDGYAKGDINYDGVIDAGDYGIIDNTFQLQGSPIPIHSTPIGITAVPEPTSAVAGPGPCLAHGGMVRAPGGFAIVPHSEHRSGVARRS